MVPQVLPALISFTVYRWDINVRMATILGLVGGGGIGQLLLESMQFSAWAKVGMIVLVITFVVWLMDMLSARARRRVG
jgi:phosphonate transport system permease protein